MRLFTVPAGRRVRITSKLIRWVESVVEHTVAENYTWEGRTTDRYMYYKSHRRRMLVDHTIDWPEYAIWQRDTEVELIDDKPPQNDLWGAKKRK